MSTTISWLHIPTSAIATYSLTIVKMVTLELGGPIDTLVKMN